jgi:hypothetical protein
MAMPSGLQFFNGHWKEASDPNDIGLSAELHACQLALLREQEQGAIYKVIL